MFFRHTYPHGVDNLKKKQNILCKLWITLISKILILLSYISTHSRTFLDDRLTKWPIGEFFI